MKTRIAILLFTLLCGGLAQAQVKLASWGAYNSGGLSLPAEANFKDLSFVNSARLDNNGMGTVNDNRSVWHNANSLAGVDPQFTNYLSFTLSLTRLNQQLGRFVINGLGIPGLNPGLKLQLRWSEDNFQSNLGDFTANGTDNYTLTSVNLSNKPAVTHYMVEFRLYGTDEAGNFFMAVGSYSPVDGTPASYKDAQTSVSIWTREPVTQRIPGVLTNSPTSITPSSLLVGGEITDTGGLSITGKGVIIDTVEMPTIDGGMKIEMPGTFSQTAYGLHPRTLYYVRAYAVNAKGIGYGSSIFFYTQAGTLPVLTTNNVSSITDSSAYTGGIISDSGSASVTERGIIYDTVPEPGTTHGTRVAMGSGEGAYTGTVKGLKPHTMYYLKAYAVNNAGIAFGAGKSFTTTGFPTGLTETGAALDFDMYPNPAHQALSIRAASRIQSLSICDQLGRIVLNSGSENTVRLEALAPGIYFIRVNGADNTSGVRKLIIE